MRSFQLFFFNSTAYPKKLLDFAGVTLSLIKKMEATGKCLAPARCGPEKGDAQSQRFSVQEGFFSAACL